MAIKILLNSLYGALGNQYFKYFDLRLAEGVTLTGQLTIQWAEKAMNKAMNEALKPMIQIMLLLLILIACILILVLWLGY